MRKFVPALTLFLAACATEPGPPPGTTPAPTTASSHRHGHLIGLSTSELGELFGAPALQVREGSGLKLQYRGGGCVLDAYLYPPPNGQGIDRVTYVDARLSSGADTDIVSCEARIEASR